MKRAQGMPGEDLTHGPPALKKAGGQSPQVWPDQPAFPARWFTAYIAISSGTGLSCPRRWRDTKHHRQLDLSVGRPGPRDFAVRDKPRSSDVPSASIASPPHVS